MLRRLRESTFRKFVQIDEAKPGPIKYPPGHNPIARVPRGGSMCANCRFLRKDGRSCRNKFFILRNGSPKLPFPADQMCTDWWRPRKRKK